MSVLAIDLGTGSVKAALVEDDLTVSRHASRPYPVHAPVPGSALGRPAEWAAAVEAAVTEVLDAAGTGTGPRRPDAVGLSGQMHGLVLLDPDGVAVTDALLWPETRATAELERLRSMLDGDLARLANPLVPGMAGPLLAYLSRTDPDVVRRAAHAVQPKDWLRAALVGPNGVGVDPSDASATLLWDVAADGYSSAALMALGIDTVLLPPVRRSRDVVGETTGALGVPAGVPVVTGAGDTACAALGTGTLRPGRGQVSIGTGGQTLVPVDVAVPDARPVVHTYRDAGDGWYRMGAVQNCGLALERVLGWLGASWDEALAALAAGSAVTPPVFLPHLSGERTPWLDPAMRGAWTGLGLEHDRGDLLRAALLGVACSVADAWDAVLAAGDGPADVLLVGGGSVHPAWRQTLADVLATPLTPASAPDAGVVGAAVLALAGLGRLTLDDAVTTLADRATRGAVTVDPSSDAGAGEQVAALRARFADARTRLAGP